MIAMTTDLLLFVKSTKATDLFLMDLVLSRLSVKRLVVGLSFTLTFPERINNSDILLYCQEGIVNTVETWVNVRLKLYGGNRRWSN